MSHISRATIALIGALTLGVASPALAVFPHLSTKLTGPAIDGQVPVGFARLDQSNLPAPGTLQLRLRNVNLPDGTVLTVVITDCVSSDSPSVGTITLNRGMARATLTLPSEPSVCQVGHNSSIFLKLGETIVLEGGSPWDVDPRPN